MHRAKELSRILVAMDGSEASMRAAKYAFDIATRSNSKCTLYLIHVIPSQLLMAHSSGYFGAVSPGYQKEVKEKAEEWFSRILSDVVRSSHMNIIRKVISSGGSIVAELTSYADKKEIELIVIGARGGSGLRRLLLGSTSAGVVTHSHCSVLVVR
jgi:nucleotide-binding universal stress UspA family protein